MALCFPMNLHAQSSETDLDQAELTKQFIGTWTVKIGGDTTVVWEIIPHNKGYEFNYSWQADGKTYLTAKGIMGFTSDQTVNMLTLWPNGWIARNFGNFVSDNKITFERYDSHHSHVWALMEIIFQTPDKFKVISKDRGDKETWDDAEVNEWTYTRVKK